MIILTCILSKSPVVGGIVVPAIVWLSIIMIYFSSSNNNGRKQKSTKGLQYGIAMNIVAFLILSVGVYSQVSQYSKNDYLNRINNASEVSRMYEDIGDFVASMNRRSTCVSADSLNDYLAAWVLLPVIYYEKHPVYLSASRGIPTSIFETSKEDALINMKDCDFMIISESNTTGFRYPYDESVNEIRPFLMEYLRKEFVFYQSYSFDDKTYIVFVNKAHRTTQVS